MFKFFIKYLYVKIIHFYYSFFFKIKLGKNAILHYPKKLEGGKNIYLGNNVFVGSDSWLATFENYLGNEYTPKIIIEDNVSIGRYACITSINNILIKKGTLISEFLYISDHTHGYDPMSSLNPQAQPLSSKGEVVVGEKCFIGYRVCIMPGVHIGNGSVVGSNSVVTKDVPPYSIVAGCPATIIKKYNFESKIWESVK